MGGESSCWAVNSNRWNKYPSLMREIIREEVEEEEKEQPAEEAEATKRLA